MATRNNSRSSGKSPKKSTGGKKTYSEKEPKSFRPGEKKSFSKSKVDSKFKKDFKSDKPKRKYEDDKFSSGEKKSFGKSKDDSKFKKDFKSDKPRRKYQDDKFSSGDKKDFGKKKHFDEPDYGKKKYTNKVFDEKPVTKSKSKKSYDEDDGDTFAWKKTKIKEEDLYSFKERDKSKKRFAQEKQKYNSLNKNKPASKQSKSDDGTVRLNRYLSNAGVCSRREADQLIISGVVKINGKIVTELGTKVLPGDKVSYGDQTLKRENIVYLLLNKPKDYITTSDDPQKRRTVMELIKGAVKERLYPVGRLDRNTTGLLLFTNDGDMATKLTHPKNNIRKVYHVVTDQNVSKEDLDKLKAGFELEDGFVAPDDIEYVGTGHNKKDIGIEIHSGKNRIVRRMFEHLGYNVVKLDRVMFAGLNKKELPRGKWRILTPKEINFLKML